jgi:two-component system sensor histidine kinase EvgS
MNSQLFFESAPGFGSNIHFCLALPRTSTAATESPIPKNTIYTRKLVSRHISNNECPLQALVVEDHPASRQIISLQLQALGIETAVCDNATNALDLINQKYFDLLLTDQSIPGMQGSELAKHVRKLGKKDLIIIGITADIYALDSRHQFLAAGMNGVLIKPLSLMILENELSRHFQIKESTAKILPAHLQEEYSFEAFTNLSKQNPDYVLEILDAIKKVHDEVLEILQSDKCDEVSFGSLVHKVKGGAQLLQAKSFIQACETLEQGGDLTFRINSFAELLRMENQRIEHQILLRYSP